MQVLAWVHLLAACLQRYASLCGIWSQRVSALLPIPDRCIW
jgi:hypothetical protein